MFLEFLILDGYGKFVWTAFIFAFGCYFYLYQITKKELQEQEKKFLDEIKVTSSKKIEEIRQKETEKEVLAGSLS